MGPKRVKRQSRRHGRGERRMSSVRMLLSLSCQKEEINKHNFLPLKKKHNFLDAHMIPLKTFDIQIESIKVSTIYLSEKYDITIISSTLYKFSRIENNRQRYTKTMRVTRSRIEKNKRILLPLLNIEIQTSKTYCHLSNVYRGDIKNPTCPFSL